MNNPANNSTSIERLAGLEELWAETFGDSRICIAVLDGPVDQSHASLATADLTHLETMVPGNADTGPASQHGTHIASVIFGQHDGPMAQTVPVPIKGVAPGCRGLVIPVFKDGDDGSITPCSQLDLARAINQAVESGAHIINISGGELTPTGAADSILAQAVRSCASSGVLIVAAAGNDGCECLHVPGALPSVLAVGATDAEGWPLGSNNWGAQYRHQGILAPGEDILGASPGGRVVAGSGTSFATPIVSGVAALLLSVQLKFNQEPDPQAIREFLLQSAYACNPQTIEDCRPFMAGSLNIRGALELVKKQCMDRSSMHAVEAKPMEVKMRNNPVTSTDRQGPLEVGDLAPGFSLQDHMGRDVQLWDYRGQNVILWFYPEADTPG